MTEPTRPTPGTEPDSAPAAPVAAKPRYSRDQVLQKRRLVRWTIGICLSLIPIFIYLQGFFYRHEDSLPISSNILIFGLINLNVLLVLFVLFLVLRSWRNCCLNAGSTAPAVGSKPS